MLEIFYTVIFYLCQGWLPFYYSVFADWQLPDPSQQEIYFNSNFRLPWQNNQVFMHNRLGLFASVADCCYYTGGIRFLTIR